MSIKAMNWAMGARTDGVSAQCVLFVVADTANEHGVSIHADPDYIAARTRQSRATIFRRLKELEEAGALTRLKRFREDGAPVYEIRLNLEAQIDYETPPDGDGTPQDIEGQSQIETQGESHAATPKVAPVRQAESQSCDSKSPSKSPKDNPPTPQGGSEAPAGGSEKAQEPSLSGSDTWPRFEAAYAEPILRQTIARQTWAALTEAERELATKAARGYVAWRRLQKKPPNVLNAHTFLREPDAWAGFAKHAPPDPTLRTFVVENSPEHAALRVIAEMGHWSTPPLQFSAEQNARGLWRGRPLKPDELAMAQFAAVPVSGWQTLDRTAGAGYFAWSDRLFDWTGVRKDSIRVPCPFPPRKDGTLSGSSTDPPSEESAA